MLTHTLTDLLTARHPLVCLQTVEEPRALHQIGSITAELARSYVAWSITGGVEDLADLKLKVSGSAIKPADACVFLRKNPADVMVLRDFGPYLKDPVVVRALRDLVQDAHVDGNTVLLMGADFETLPPEIVKMASILDLDLPGRHTIARMIRALWLTKEPGMAGITDAELEAALPVPAELIDALTGLTEIEISNALALCQARLGYLDAKTLAAEKRQIIRKNGLLEFIDAEATIESIGGLGRVKRWLKSRSRARGDKAQAFGLRKPKGLLLTGVAGTGKSLTAKAAASILGVPLIRLDIGRVFAGLVGSSEANIRSVIRTIDAIGPCVLWIDEIEKGFGGGGANDGNTSARVLGSFLSWMNDRTSDCFVVATANRVQSLPAELIRKGRFDEVFFVGLPNEKERLEILTVHLSRMRCAAHLARSPLGSVLKATNGFSGGEIEQLVSDAAFAAFDAGDEHVAVTHLLDAAKATRPLSQTSAQQVEELIDWAKDHAVNASEE